MNLGAAPSSSNFQSYTDFQALSALRSEAHHAPAEALDDVASQFESLFVQMMLKSMRDATIEGGLFDSNQLELYQQMFDQQISLDISQNGGVGLAETLSSQLGGQQTAAAQQPTGLQQTTIDQTKPVEPLVALNRNVDEIKRQILDLYAAANDSAPHGDNVTPIVDVNAEMSREKTQWLPASPEEFIRNIWNHAVGAAKELGLDPAVLVAQSALETGWGKKVIQADEGSSFNLFGIKADGRWDGEAATVNTVEFRDGLAVMEKASFRAYDSLASAFNDYVDFLKGNPRYQQALDKVTNNEDFLAELQGAGYATDPEYAEKILGILGKGQYSSVINELKNSQELPLSI